MDDLQPCRPLAAFMQAAGFAIDAVMGRLGQDDRRQLELAMEAGAIVGYSIRLDVDLRSAQQPAVVFEAIRADGHRVVLHTSTANVPTAH